MSPKCLPPSFCFLRPAIREQMRFEDFQDGHLGDNLRYRNEMILAILNLYVALMPPIKFGLNTHFGMGDNVVLKILKRPSWMLEWNKFSSSESLCLPNASHQVSA